MALSVTAQSSGRAPPGVSPPPIRSARGEQGGGRRSLISFVAVSVAATLPEASDPKKALLQRYLERSRQNREKNEKERLDDYYRRNYKDYFDFVEGSTQGKDDEQLSESEKGIREWLRKNK